MQQEGNDRPQEAAKSHKSTRDHVVNDRRAEILAENFDGFFEAEEIRGNLGGEPVAKAWGLLEWAAKKRWPLKAQDKAKKDGLEVATVPDVYPGISGEIEITGKPRILRAALDSRSGDAPGHPTMIYFTPEEAEEVETHFKRRDVVFNELT